jgi:hypothetical protein
MSNQIVVCLSDTKAVAFEAYQVSKPQAYPDKATNLVFGKTYRRIYQDKVGFYAIYMGKRKTVLLLDKGL